MSDSVPSARYSSVCNVSRLWSISLIPTYRISAIDNLFRLGVQNVSLSLTLGAHMCSEGYGSYPVCVVCVRSFLPPRASIYRPRSIGTYGFNATRKTYDPDFC